jgi:N-glycosylase/DNA lyase
VEKQETSIIEAQEMASVTESITEEAPHTLWRRIQQFSNPPGHYENLSWNTGINLGFLMLSAGGIRMSHYLQK